MGSWVSLLSRSDGKIMQFSVRFSVGLAVNRRRGISSHFCFYLTNSDPSPLSLPISGKKESPPSVRLAEEGEKIPGQITPPL